MVPVHHRILREVKLSRMCILHRKTAINIRRTCRTKFTIHIHFQSLRQEGDQQRILHLGEIRKISMSKKGLGMG